MLLNPLTNYLIMFRDVMFNHTLPSLGAIVIGLVEMILALMLGLSVFSKKQDALILDL